jgi:hypothetical protein
MRANTIRTALLAAGTTLTMGTTLMMGTAWAQAPACVAQSQSHLINGGVEAAGVPNYAQADFYGGNDCGPTAAGMLLGYYDATGWACLMPGGDPYYSGAASPGVVSTVGLLAEALPYSSIFGMAPIAGQDSIGEGVVQVAAARGAGSWTFDEDFTLDYGKIAADLNADRPVMMALLGNGGTFTWANGATAEVDWHWFTVMGYRYELTGEMADGVCVPDGESDVFFDLRTGWQDGGNEVVTYHVGFWDDAVAVHVRPPAGGGCTDQVDADGDGVYVTQTSDGTVLGGDCDDADPWVFPGAAELCNGLDDDCDGVSDEGFPDVDGDGVGDPCDPDSDNDGVDDWTDNCPHTPNGLQDDVDGDGMGDACDDCPGGDFADADGDGLCDRIDNCPGWASASLYDGNGDGIGRACDWDEDGVRTEVDNCPDHANADQADLDGDGVGDACDADEDGDGVVNDNCPRAVNPNQADFDGDGKGDVCECVGGLFDLQMKVMGGHCPGLIETTDPDLLTVDTTLNATYEAGVPQRAPTLPSR